MFLINTLIFNAININEFNISFFILLVSFLDHFGFEILISIIIIYIAARPQKVLDTASKVVTIATGSTVLYNNWVKDGSNEDKDEKKDNKDEDKKEENKDDQTDKSTNQATTDEK